MSVHSTITDPATLDAAALVFEHLADALRRELAASSSPDHAGCDAGAPFDASTARDCEGAQEGRQPKVAEAVQMLAAELERLEHLTERLAVSLMPACAPDAEVTAPLSGYATGVPLADRLVELAHDAARVAEMLASLYRRLEL